MIPYTPMEHWNLWFIEISPHGFFAVVGMIIVFIIVLGTARKQKIHSKIIFAEAVLGFIAAWIISKLFYYLGPYGGACCASGIKQMAGRGFVFYGGLIGATIAIYAYTKIKRYNFWKHADFWGLGIPLGIFIARIGCFLVNDALGKITSFRFAIQLPDGTIRHPAALYMSFFNLLLFVYLYSRKTNKKFMGFIFLQYLIIYSAGRFVIEFFRVYTFHYLGLTFSQWISIIVFAAALTTYIIKSRKV